MLYFLNKVYSFIKHNKYTW